MRPPSRHRAAVWRELRETGALPLGQGVWAVPDVPERVFAHLRAFSHGSDEGAR
ncbi:Chromate resistance protein ChrB [Streptomyces misionensis]|uniref:Chromate resistance protein ChrB n=1 Tax=Streptomyces misionensis TaxID=67331 RepID=UPI0033A357FE